MKLRLLPVILSVVVSASVLFGGYFAYQSVAMENPPQNVVTSIPGVELVQMNLSGTKAELELKLASDTSLRDVYQQIQKQGASVIGDSGTRHNCRRFFAAAGAMVVLGLV